ncbi:MAG TPA: ABC-F family ATP-binding cassette domain-containing protein [Thermomicrobiales bacterium]|nr:ABC-F family ATP-binding cassette domain-containing protein [Thermomicrobiales bacterium]
MPPVPILTVNDLGKSYGAEEIFSRVTFQIVEREHVALVGVNGAGKSTVLRIIAGIEPPNEGTIAPLKGLRITYLPQEASFTSDKTLREEARLAFTPVLDMQTRMRDIERQMASAGDDHLEAIMDEYARLQTRFETAGGYDIEHRTDEVLNGLGFSEEQFDQPVAQLSGGQKTRVALAKALLADPDLLLLDEPTNHLDLEMLEWLEDFLRSWNGACLIVSHDRYFLDRVTSRTMDLSFGRLEDYPAPYGRFLKLREERTERRWKEFQEQQEYIARQEEFIKKYGAGQRYREARGRQKKLDRLERIERPQEHDRLAIRIGSATRSGRMVLSTTEMSIGYEEDSETGQPVELLRTPELEVELGDRIGLLGPNGSGKTTLLKTLMGILPALEGDYHLGTNVHPGYYAQSHEQLRGRGEGTPLSVILNVQPMSEEAARTYLGRFLFSGDDVYKQVASLSGGERSRLALAVLLLERANFLVLDEPTNHLDINARESLEHMLTGFDGTILFVSHDRYFIDKVATKLWVVEDGTITEQLGNYTDFHRRLEAAPPPAEPKPEPKPEPIASPTGDAMLTVSSKGKPRRKTSADVEKRLTKVEREISQLEGKVNELSDALAIASADQDLDAVARLGEEYERLLNELEDTYQRWEAITEERELVAAEAGE